MKLTPEERKLRAIDRENEIKQRDARFPYAELSRTSDEKTYSRLVMEAGEEKWIGVWKRGDWYAESHEPWERSWIYIDNPADLARFIRALVARYNVLVAEMNDDASASRMAKADTIT